MIEKLQGTPSASEPNACSPSGARNGGTFAHLTFFKRIATVVGLGAAVELTGCSMPRRDTGDLCEQAAASNTEQTPHYELVTDIAARAPFQFSDFIESLKTVAPGVDLDTAKNILSEYSLALDVLRSEIEEFNRRSGLTTDPFGTSIYTGAYDPAVQQKLLDRIHKLKADILDFSRVVLKSRIAECSSCEWTFSENQRVADLEERYGPYQEYFAKLFKSITGKELPTEIQIRLYAPDQTNAGFKGEYIHTNRLMMVKDGAYVSVLKTAAHEAWHYICAARRDKESLIIDNPWTFPWYIIEEAAAKIFSLAFVMSIPDKELREQGLEEYKVHALYNCRNNSIGTEQFNYHNLAGALADAALTYFGNPKDALNYLRDAQVLLPEIVEIVNENRLTYSKLFPMRLSLL